MTAPGRLREAMPQTAAFIDELRAAFGREAIDGQIRKGMQGLPCFWASENGIEIGTRAKDAGQAFSVAELVIESAPWQSEGARK